MPHEQLLKLGKTATWSCFDFIAKSTLTFGLSLLGNICLEELMRPHYIRIIVTSFPSQLRGGGWGSTMGCAVPCGFPLVPWPGPTSLNTSVSWSDKGWWDPGPERGKLQQSQGKRAWKDPHGVRDTSQGAKRNFGPITIRTQSFHRKNFDVYPHPRL